MDDERALTLDTINRILGVFGLQLVYGWLGARIQVNDEDRSIEHLELDGVHFHIWTRRPSWLGRDGD